MLRLLRSTREGQGDAQAVVGRRLPGVQAQGLAEGEDGFGEPVLLEERLPDADLGFGPSRVQPQCVPEGGPRFVEATVVEVGPPQARMGGRIARP
jgi:hypothetical protein